ncbi:hypothetical protein MLD38_033227 [Melastoma candidum]|uniref:Uncharacterized protein n=1 Tax=Melastoma candidum TaxID=119954 RepID=A0ACB9M7D3_9MYRT|nr:hypothetical protein MLD38_033227 [Melastoma candidum]
MGLLPPKQRAPPAVLLQSALFFISFVCRHSFCLEVEKNQSAWLLVNASRASGHPISDRLFGIFFEEINHAGAGGLWAELVNNRGFEAGGPNTPSYISPWSTIGNESYVMASTDRSSCFDLNKVALRLDVLCDDKGDNACPADGVGIYNPGFWGMNIEKGKTYKVVFHVRSSDSVNLSISLTGSSGSPVLASASVIASASDVLNWTKMEVRLEATATNHNSRLQITTNQQEVIWFDQVSAMPEDTYLGHGFRSDLMQMLAQIKPKFLRFPGGDYVKGEWLQNAFHWKDTVGPWEERPGHYNDVWNYWTDDALGFFEFLQLAEELGALPVWVFHSGFSIREEIETPNIHPFVREALDGLEFARGDSDSTWGSVRANMGHPKPFDLRYIAIGNQDCGRKNYRGNYLEFYNAIKQAYPDTQVISNCDGSSQKLDHPSDLYDVHVYTSANNMFSMAHQFDQMPRTGPKVFVSEYAVTDGGKGNLLAALAQAAFLIGLEKNSDIVDMASNAPLFVNANDRSFSNDAIVFDSSQIYGTPGYWVQSFFAESSGATILSTSLQTNSTSSLIASAISWQDSDNQNTYLRIKVVNYGSNSVNLKISLRGFDSNSIKLSGLSKSILTSAHPTDENTFQEPQKVFPKKSPLRSISKDVDVLLSPYSFTSLDFLEKPSILGIPRIEESSADM